MSTLPILMREGTRWLLPASLTWLKSTRTASPLKPLRDPSKVGPHQPMRNWSLKPTLHGTTRLLEPRRRKRIYVGRILVGVSLLFRLAICKKPYFDFTDTHWVRF